MRWQYQAHERRPNSSFGKEGTEGKCSCSKKEVEKANRKLHRYVDCPHLCRISFYSLMLLCCYAVCV